MNGLFRDARLGLHMLATRPLFTVTVVVILGLGIGLSTSVFNLVNAFLYKPLPGIRDPRGLVLVGRTENGRGFDTFGWPDLSIYREQVGGVEALVACWTQGLTVGNGEEFGRRGVAMVSGDYFTALRTRAVAGRLLGEAYEDPDLPPEVVVISEALAQEWFGSPPRALGRELVVEGTTLVVVGVAEAGFRGTSIVERADLWVSLALQPRLMPGRVDLLHTPGTVWLQAFARLKPDVEMAMVQAELDRISAVLREQRPDVWGARGAVAAGGFGLWPFFREMIGRSAALMLAGVGLVLMIVCANVANLLLVHGISRRRELGIRSVLGASRGQLIRHLLVESVLLALAGGGLGLLIALWGSDGLRLVVAATPLAPAAGVIDYTFDARVLLFGSAVSLGTVLLFGLLPALTVSRIRTAGTLKEGRDQASVGVRLREVLVAGQFALSLTLLVLAGLFARSLDAFLKVDPGFDAEQVLVAGFRLDPQRYTGDRGTRFLLDLIDRLEDLPGVASAAVGDNVPLVPGRSSTTLMTEGLEPPEGEQGWDVDFRAVSSAYREVMGIPLRVGRFVGPEDGASAPRVAVVNETLARRFWPEGGAVGSILLEPYRDRTIRWEVVGVVADSKYMTLSETPRLHVYFPYSQRPDPESWLYLRSVGERAAALAGPLRATVRTADPNLPLYDIRTLEEQLEQSVGATSVGGALAVFCALLALLLAAVGLYGTLAFQIRLRTREIGVRIALGAPTSSVVRMVLGQGMQLVGIGAVVGLAAGAAVAVVLRGIFYGVAPWDPLTYVAVTLILGVTALSAIVLPARRAARIDPIEALRVE
jgi:predicted permease